MARPELQTPEQVLQVLFDKDLGITRPSLKPLNPASTQSWQIGTHRGSISETYAGPKEGTVVKILQNPIRDNQIHLATHVLALERIQKKLPFLLHVPRILETGKIGGKPAVIESRLPHAISDKEVDKIRLATTPERIEFLTQMFKFLSVIAGTGIIPIDYKLNDLDISEKPTLPVASLLPSFGIVDLGGAFTEGSPVNMWVTREQSWQKSIVSTTNVIRQLFGDQYTRLVPSFVEVDSFKELSQRLLPQLANVPQKTSLY